MILVAPSLPAPSTARPLAVKAGATAIIAAAGAATAIAEPVIALDSY